MVSVTVSNLQWVYRLLALMLVRDDEPVMTYIIPVAVLKDLCRKYVGTDRDVVGGDDNNSKGILLPIEELATACLNNDRE